MSAFRVDIHVGVREEPSESHAFSAPDQAAALDRLERTMQIYAWNIRGCLYDDSGRLVAIVEGSGK